MFSATQLAAKRAADEAVLNREAAVAAVTAALQALREHDPDIFEPAPGVPELRELIE